MLAEFSEHPFAQYVRLLARGKTKSRPLTEEEAEAAMDMIMARDVHAEQLGAFLMLLRFKEESPEEIAGFVRGARSSLELPKNKPQVDIDWSSYAGKQKQLPWFLLSVLLLSNSGIKILMHGTEGHTTGRIYTKTALEKLRLPVANSLDDAVKKIQKFNYSYLPLEKISPRLQEIMDLKSILGLRSPVHTIARLLNPFDAPCLLQGIFHRSFMKTHQRAAQLLDQSHMAVFRGDGGEIEIRPNKPTEVFTVHGTKLSNNTWPAMLNESHQQIDQYMDLNKLKNVWEGSIQDDYAIAAIVGTTAIALDTLGTSNGVSEAMDLARNLWAKRDINYLDRTA